MIVTSCWGQIDETIQGEIEPNNTAIIVSKLAILGLSLVSLVFDDKTQFF